MTRCSGLSNHHLPHAWHLSQLAVNLSLDKSKPQIHVKSKSGCSGGREGRRGCTFLNFVQAHILAQPTNVVLINSSQYIISFSLTLRQVSTNSTSNSYKTFRIPYHRGPKRPDADFEKMFNKRILSSKFQPYVNTFYPPTEPARSMSPELNFSPRLVFF